MRVTCLNVLFCHFITFCPTISFYSLMYVIYKIQGHRWGPNFPLRLRTCTFFGLMNVMFSLEITLMNCIHWYGCYINDVIVIWMPDVATISAFVDYLS